MKNKNNKQFFKAIQKEVNKLSIEIKTNNNDVAKRGEEQDNIFTKPLDRKVMGKVMAKALNDGNIAGVEKDIAKAITKPLKAGSYGMDKTGNTKDKRKYIESGSFVDSIKVNIKNG